MILVVSRHNDLYLVAEQGQGAVERLGAYTGRLFGVAAKGVGTRGGGVEGRGPCACPAGIMVPLDTQSIHGQTTQHDEDKHKAPSSTPLHTLSLRWGRGWFGKLLCITEGEGVDNEK